MPAAACRTLFHREFQADNCLHCRFHVDDLSSAHVYLRLPVGVDMDSVPADTLEDCCQLVKHNSISGNKLNNVGIVYTPWANLRKTASMEVGQVRFASAVVTSRQHGAGEREHRRWHCVQPAARLSLQRHSVQSETDHRNCVASRHSLSERLHGRA